MEVARLMDGDYWMEIDSSGVAPADLASLETFARQHGLKVQ